MSAPPHTPEAEAVYDFYGETDTWMYDRRAVEVIKPDDDDKEDAYYDMFF